MSYDFSVAFIHCYKTFLGMAEELREGYRIPTIDEFAFDTFDSDESLQEVIRVLKEYFT